MTRTHFALALFFGMLLTSPAQNHDTLCINYYSQYAFAEDKDGELKGLEVDIIREYVNWLQASKKLTVIPKFVKFTDFDQFYSRSYKASKNHIGLGSVTVNAERLKEADFTSPYLKNVSFCVTNGNAPDIKTKTPDAIVRVLGHMTALTLTNSTLHQRVLEVKRGYLPDLRIVGRHDEVSILNDIAGNVLYFGYVDAVSFWFYLKTNPQKFLKIQKALSHDREELAFLLPKGSPHKKLFDEFFSGPAGFKKSKAYRAILEKHLGTYMTQSMAVN